MSRPFARHYYVDLERDYPAVWWDDHQYATFGRLLAVAESMWPAVPEIPRSARGTVVQKLVDSGLVIAVPPFSYRIKGMDAERTARSNAASNAARIRHGIAPTMPSQPASQANQRARSAPKNGSATMEEAFAKLGMPVGKP